MQVSASVMVTFVTRRVSDTHALEVLVLWRGTPGWSQPTGSSGSSSSGGSSGGSWSERYSRGSFSFEISGDARTRTANILGRTLDLTKGNAILVEGADSPNGPQIARTLVVDTPLPNGANLNEILKVLGQVKELREYLRCGIPLPDPALQARIASMCALVLAQ